MTKLTCPYREASPRCEWNSPDLKDESLLGVYLQGHLDAIHRAPASTTPQVAPAGASPQPGPSSSISAKITQAQAHMRLPRAMQTNSILQYTSPNICMAKSMAKSESESATRKRPIYMTSKRASNGGAEYRTWLRKE